MSNSYVKNILGCATNQHTENAAIALWKIASERDLMSEKNDLKSTNSCPESIRVYITLIDELLKLESEIININGKDGRYHFLLSHWESRLPSRIKRASSHLIKNCRSLDEIAVSTLSLMSISSLSDLEKLTTPNNLSSQVNQIQTLVNGVSDSLNTVNDMCGSDGELYDLCCVLTSRLQSKSGLISFSLKLLCGILRRDENVIKRCVQTLQRGDWGINSSMIKPLLKLCEGLTLERNTVSTVKEELRQLTIKHPCDITLLDDARKRCIDRLRQLNVPENVISETTKIASNAISHQSKSEHARQALTNAMKSSDVDRIKSAILHAEEVGMKDTDSTLRDAEQFLESHTEVSNIINDLRYAKDLESLSSAIIRTNTFLKNSGIYLEKTPQVGVDGKVIPPTTGMIIPFFQCK